MSEGNLPLSERILIFLHNLGATYRDSAKKSTEITASLQSDAEETSRILDKYEYEGYAKSFVDGSGIRRYYLTRFGIIRICSYFT